MINQGGCENMFFSLFQHVVGTKAENSQEMRVSRIEKNRDNTGKTRKKPEKTGCKRMLLDAIGCKWMRLAANGYDWLQLHAGGTADGAAGGTANRAAARTETVGTGSA